MGSARGSALHNLAAKRDCVIVDGAPTALSRNRFRSHSHAPPARHNRKMCDRTRSTFQWGLKLRLSRSATDEAGVERAWANNAA